MTCSAAVIYSGITGIIEAWNYLPKKVSLLKPAQLLFNNNLALICSAWPSLNFFQIDLKPFCKTSILYSLSRLTLIRHMAKSYKAHTPNNKHGHYCELLIYKWQWFHHFSLDCATFFIRMYGGWAFKTSFVVFICPWMPGDFLISFWFLDL